MNLVQNMLMYLLISSPSLFCNFLYFVWRQSENQKNRAACSIVSSSQMKEPIPWIVGYVLGIQIGGHWSHTGIMVIQGMEI